MSRIVPLTLFASLLLLGASASAENAARKTQPIEHSDHGELSKKEVRSIFLGKRQTWDDGKRMIIASLKAGGTHSQFLKEWVGMTPNQFRTYWRKRVFTGKGTMPTWLASEREQIAFVVKTPGAIGYRRTSSKERTTGGAVYFDPKTARYVQFSSRLKRRS